jgi:hypothetical protein
MKKRIGVGKPFIIPCHDQNALIVQNMQNDREAIHNSVSDLTQQRSRL